MRNAYIKNRDSGEWEEFQIGPKYDFSAAKAWNGQIKAEAIDDLYLVEEISTFKNVYIVRASCPDEAEDYVSTESESSPFQKHLGSTISSVRKVRSDADVVEMIQQTEQPNMTLELFTAKRALWYRNNINE